MEVYSCDNCPHTDIMFCHNCLNEDKSPLIKLYTAGSGDFGKCSDFGNYGNVLLAKKILEPWKESDKGLKRYLIVGHSGPGGRYINEVITADSEESAALWFYRTFTNTCSIVNIIQLK